MFQYDELIAVGFTGFETVKQYNPTTSCCFSGLSTSASVSKAKPISRKRGRPASPKVDNQEL